MYYFEEEVAEAAKEAGLRGVLGQTDHPVPGGRREDARGRAGAHRAFIAEYKGDPLIAPAVAPHSMYTLERRDAAGGRRAGATSTACRC